MTCCPSYTEIPSVSTSYINAPAAQERSGADIEEVTPDAERR
jgi:hypothetical protein